MTIDAQAWSSDERALPDPIPTSLNLGCGQFPRAGFLNVDVDPGSKADLLLDLNDMGEWAKLPSGHFLLISMSHSLEHLHEVFPVMAELHRIMKVGGRLEIQVPHFSRGITHPQHEHGFDVTFPEYFNPRFPGFTGVAFDLLSMRLDYMIRFDLKEPLISRWQIAVLKRLNKVLNYLANKQPYACSRFWCFLVGGFEQIEFIFQKTT